MNLQQHPLHYHIGHQEIVIHSVYKMQNDRQIPSSRLILFYILNYLSQSVRVLFYVKWSRGLQFVELNSIITGFFTFRTHPISHVILSCHVYEHLLHLHMLDLLGRGEVLYQRQVLPAQNQSDLQF